MVEGDGAGRDIWRVAAIGAAAVALVLGVVGLAQYAPDRSVQDVLYGALQLFVMEGDPIGEPPYNVWLEIARFLAPATTAYAVFETLRALVGGELRRRQVARSRHHVIVCGDDAASSVLAGTIRSAGRRVVLVGETMAGRHRRGGIDVVRGDPRDPVTLRAAGIGGAAALYACAPESDENAAVVLTATQLSAGRGARFAAFAQVKDDDLLDALRALQLSIPQSRGATADFFALEGTAARAVLADCALTGDAGPVVIVGDSPFGRALLRALLRGPGRDGARWDVRVHADDPAAVSELASRLGAAERGFTVTTAALGDLVPAPSERIFVCLADEEATMARAVRLAREPGREVVACLRRATPFQETLGGVDRLRVVGVLDEACRLDRIEADALSHRMARVIHEQYVELRRTEGDTASTNDSVRAWAGLPPHLKESNYAQAEHIAVKLRAIGATVTTVRPGRPFAFRAGEVEQLARLEHKRWMDERLAAGFVWGPHRTDKHHPDLRDWPDMPSDSRRKDIEAVEFLPRLLESEGLYLVRRQDA